MAELDSLIDSLIQQRNAPTVSYIDDRYVKTLKLEQIPAKGQGVFAQQLLPVDAPICSVGYPTMMAIDSDFLQTTCYHCLVVTAAPLPLPAYGHASMELKTCNGCHSARFCNRQCQVEAWHAYHKYECKIFKKVQKNLPPAILRAVLRMVLLKDRDMLTSEEWNRITSLTSHEQILAARGRSNITDMAEGIKHLAESSMSIDMIQKLIFVIKFNAIELPTPIYGGIGVMVEPLVAKFNHSCEPNSSIHRPQHTMASGWMSSTRLSEDERRTFAQVIPLRDIQPGEEIFNCYVVPTVSASDRRVKLMEDYFFQCNCPKCLSDMKALTDLADEQPGLSAQFDQWIQDVVRHLSRVRGSLDAFQKAAAAMDKSSRFLEYPVLYTTGKFPEMAMTLILEGLKAHAFDEALVNVLRLYFLVNPQRFVGRHNPTNIYTTFIVLVVFDAIIGISRPSGTTNDQVEKWLRKLSTRGLSKGGLMYWRHRVCADLRKRLEGSAAKDLLVLVEQREELAKHFTAQDQIAGGEELKESAEQEMRAVLRLQEPRWKIVLEKNGC